MIVESPVQMGTSRALFGILNRPHSSHDPAVVILNAGLLHHIGPYRLHVSLARRLSAEGYTVLRLDQSGKGESPPRVGLSYADSIAQDYRDVLTLMGRHRITRTVLIGLCSGADDALEIARREPSVAGLVMLDGYAPAGVAHAIHHYLPRLASAPVWSRALKRTLARPTRRNGDAPPTMLGLRNWRSRREMLDSMRAVLGGDKRLLAIFTGGVAYYYNHSGQLSKHLRSYARSGVLRELYLREATHTYTDIRHREWLLDQVGNWLREHFPVVCQ